MKTEKEKEEHQQYIPGVQEKTTLGGPFNTGVTSLDPEEKNEIEKKGSLAILKPKEEEGEIQKTDGEKSAREGRSPEQ